MWYLIFIHDSGNVYVHEYKTKEEALKEYSNYEHLSEDKCKIILSVGDVLNKYKLDNDYNLILK